VLVRLERFEAVERVGIAQPAHDRISDRDSHVAAVDIPEVFGHVRASDDRIHLPAVDPVPEVIRRQQGRRWDDDRTQLHRGERDLPQLNLVAEHDEDLHPASHALPPQPSRDLI
jgi:hypothetical protein